jgi:hypothetical protein
MAVRLTPFDTASWLAESAVAALLYTTYTLGMAYLDCNQASNIPRRTSRRKSVYQDAEDSGPALRTISRTSEYKNSNTLEVKDQKNSSEAHRRRASSASGSRPVIEEGIDSLPVVPFDLEDTPRSEYLDGGFGWVIVASMYSKGSHLYIRSHASFTGTFVIAFHFLGFLYGWGVIQAHLLGKGLASSQLLSVIGGLQAFFNAAGCMPVSFCTRVSLDRSDDTSGRVARAQDRLAQHSSPWSDA